MYTYTFSNKIQQLGLVSYTLNLNHEQDYSQNVSIHIVVNEDQDNKNYLNSIAQNIINQQIYLNSLKNTTNINTESLTSSITSTDILEQLPSSSVEDVSIISADIADLIINII